MNIKTVAVIVILCLAVVFLGLDKCGSSRKADELKGKYEEASRIAKVERLIKEATIKEQQGIIEKQDLLIAKTNEKVEIKNNLISSLGNTVTELEDEFGNLTDKDAKISNLTKQVEAWKQKFSISQSIISDKDAIIFSLTQKYESQVVISLEYKSMDEASRGLLEIRDNQVKELEKLNKRLRLGSGLKTGIVITMAGVVLYSLLK